MSTLALATLALAASSSTTPAGPLDDCAYPTPPLIVGEDRPDSDAAYAMLLRADDRCTHRWLEAFGWLRIVDRPATSTASTAPVRFTGEPGLHLYVEDAHGRLVLGAALPILLPMARATAPGEPLPPGSSYARWTSYRSVTTAGETGALPRGPQRVAVALADEPLREIVLPIEVDGPLTIEAHVERYPVARPVSGALLGAGALTALIGGTWAALEEADHARLVEEPHRVGPYVMVGVGAATAAVGALLLTWVFEEEAVIRVHRD